MSLTADIVFPPVHDVALPHIAGPLLKAYLAQRIPDLEVRCVDLNQRFFGEVVFGLDYEERLDGFRAEFARAASSAEAVSVALGFDDWIRACCAEWMAGNPGFRLSFRLFNSPYDRRDREVVRRAATEMQVFDTVFESYLSGPAPDVLGLGLSVEDQILPAFRLAHLARRRWPDCRIVLGGNLISRIHPALEGPLADLWDYLVIREGEEPFAELIESFVKGGAKPADRRVIGHGDASEASITSPFALPGLPVTAMAETAGCPDFADLPVLRYCALVPMLPVLASRKCYWGRCKFCTIHSAWDDAARKDTPDRVFATLESHVTNDGIRAFRFIDEACPPDLLRTLADLIVERGLKIDFEIYAIAERRFRDAPFVARLGAAGCRQAYFGLESSDPETLRLMGKGINQVNAYSEIFGLCAAAGIHVYVYTLFGYPGVPRRAEEDTAEYVRAETNIHTATIASFVPVAGSPFAVENAANLSHDGGMTEDFTTLRSSSGLEVPVGELGSDAARAALDRVLGHRRDLALTTLLNDEVRFALSSRFGADFAQRTGTAGRADIQGTAVEEAGHERIERALPLAPAERQAGALSFHHVLLYRAWDSRSWGRMSPMGNPGQSRGR